MTLKEILSRRKEQAQNTPAQAVFPDTDNQAVAVEIPNVQWEICPELAAFHALFEDCTDF